jgi:gamma-glutamylcyclotransferase (GGCT)/AIG2-like uncharacterized protein YtfP
MTEHLRVFVYGTLKPGECNFDRYCGDRVIASDRAYIQGDLYDFRRLGYPGAIKGNGKIHGFVLLFADLSILTALDELEDYDPHRDPSLNDYDRQLVTTSNLDGSIGCSAWVYWMSPDKVRTWGGSIVPDGWWGKKTN